MKMLCFISSAVCQLQAVARGLLCVCMCVMMARLESPCERRQHKAPKLGYCNYKRCCQWFAEETWLSNKSSTARPNWAAQPDKDEMTL